MEAQRHRDTKAQRKSALRVFCCGFSLCLCVSLYLCFLLASPAVSQEVTQRDDKRLTLKTSTEVVLVNVQVRDGKGNFVRDLKKDDFTITEDGKVQNILSLDI